MKKILFLHGFFATGSCPMARALKEAFTCRKERRPGDVSRHDRLKRNTQKALERGKLFAKPDDRIEELTALIDECYKKHLI